jgi:hypothetical protein
MVFMRPRATPSPPAAPPKVELSKQPHVRNEITIHFVRDEPKVELGEQPHVRNEIATPFVRDEQRPEKNINDSTMFSMVDLI